MNGIVKSIYPVGVAGEPTVSVKSAHAVPGKGFEGNRYYYKKGYWSHRGNLPRDITLIDSAVLDRLETEHGMNIEPGEHRRNIETTGVPLIELVDKVFKVGPVSLKGVRICQPCSG